MEAMDTAVQQSADTQTPNGGGSDFESMAIPETYKDTPVGKYKTIGEVVKGYGEAQKLIGAKGVIVPSEKATPEEVEKFYNSLGRPEKPDGYKLSPMSGLHPEVDMSPETEAGFKAFMHKHGIPQREADGIRKDYYTMMSQSLVKRDQEMLTKKHSAETALRQEWGAEYGTRLSQASQLVEKFGGEGAREAFGDLGNNPIVLKTLGNLAKHFNEDTFVKGNPVVAGGENALKLKNIMLDKKHPYWVEGVGHDEAVAEVMRLQESLTPNERNATRE
jgi:hypothetical protein